MDSPSYHHLYEIRPMLDDNLQNGPRCHPENAGMQRPFHPPKSKQATVQTWRADLHMYFPRT